MLSSAIEKVVDKWTGLGIIGDNTRDVYIYGLDLLLFTVINLLTITVTAALTGRLTETLILLAVVIPLQVFGGGYHAETHLRCFLIMFIGWWIVYPLIFILQPVSATVIASVSLIIVFVFAPVPHSNAPMSDRKQRKMKKIACVQGIIISTLCLASIWVFDVADIGFILATGMAVTAFSMLCAWLKSLYMKRKIYSRR